jgi:hypothetical protein
VCIGLLQVNNKADGNFDPFTEEQQKVLELAAEQLSEISHGRTDVFINSGSSGASAASSSGGFSKSVDGAQIVSTAELQTPFQLTFSSVSLSASDLEVIERENIVQLTVCVSLHLALGQLCPEKTIVRDLELSSLTSSSSSSSRNVGNSPMQVRFHDDIVFDINMSDLPRATRILFRILGRKKKPKQAPLVPIGWAASTLFDFKSCLETAVELKLFPGDNLVPVNTTLSNSDAGATMINALLAPDVVTGALSVGGVGKSLGVGGNNSSAVNGGGVRNKVVHGMSVSGMLEVGDAKSNSIAAEAHRDELSRILLLSFNPLSASLMTESDKEFLWDLRYSIIDRAELLPSFVMSVQWNRFDRMFLITVIVR